MQSGISGTGLYYWSEETIHSVPWGMLVFKNSQKRVPFSELGSDLSRSEERVSFGRFE